MTARCTRAASGAGRAGGPAPWHPAASLAVRPPGGQPGRPAAPPTHTTRPRGRRLRPAPPFCSRPSVPPPPAPPRPQRAPVPPPRAAPEEPFMPSSALRARGVPAPPSLAIPRGGPMPPPVPEDVSEKGILRDSLFRNVLCEGGGLFPFQKRPLRGCRAISFSETSFAKGAGCFLFRNVLCGGAGPAPLRSALRHARRHLGPSLPHLSRGHFPLRPLGLPSLEVDEVPCLPDSPCAPSASASVFVYAVSSASSCSSI